MKVSVDEDMKKYKLSSPSSSSSTGWSNRSSRMATSSAVASKTPSKSTLLPSPPLPLFSPFTASSASSATKRSVLHTPTSTVGSSTSELLSFPNSARSEANHVLFSLVCVTVASGRQQCFYEEDIEVIWPCSVIMVAITHDALKLLLDAYLHKRE
jgi:hypothetical protein